MAKESRTIFDLSEEEYEDYEKNPDKYPDVTENTEQDAYDRMYPDGTDD